MEFYRMKYSKIILVINHYKEREYIGCFVILIRDSIGKAGNKSAAIQYLHVEINVPLEVRSVYQISFLPVDDGLWLDFLRYSGAQMDNSFSAFG